MTMVVQTHPKWKYHPTQPACIVQDEDEEAQLGEGWFDSPNQFPAADAESGLDDDAKPKRPQRKQQPQP
jgi:hypothetical protein